MGWFICFGIFCACAVSGEFPAEWMIAAGLFAIAGSIGMKDLKK